MISKSLSFSGQTTDTDERQENRESVSDEEPKHENILLRMKGSRIVAKDLGQPTIWRPPKTGGYQREIVRVNNAKSNHSLAEFTRNIKFAVNLCGTSLKFAPGFWWSPTNTCPCTVPTSNRIKTREAPNPLHHFYHHWPADDRPLPTE